MMKKIILFCFLILSSCKMIDSDEQIVDINEKLIYHASIVAVGDNLIHHTIYESVYQKGSYNFEPIYEDIKAYIKKYDLAFINQESILGGLQLGLSSYPLFNSPFELGDALIDCGFNLISLANNHSLDKGENGIEQSVNYWQKKGIIYSGTEVENTERIKTFTVNHIKFAYVAYTYGTNGLTIPEGKDYLVNLYSYENAKKDIDSVKDEVDVIIVSMHWGNEYFSTPSENQILQANELANLGVDIILGHHPHVIEPYDEIIYNEHKTYVTYSLGNFLSDQNGVDRLIGMAFSLDIQKNEKVITIMNPKAKLFYTYKNNGKFKNLLFEHINQQILNDYQFQFDNKKNIIQALNSNITI